MYTTAFRAHILNMTKIDCVFQIELPEDFGTVDSMADMTHEELLALVAKEVEQGLWLNSDIDPTHVKVNVIVNGQVQVNEAQRVEVSAQVTTPDSTNPYPIGTKVIVTMDREETHAEVVGYDSKYRLPKVRSSCGRVMLRKVVRVVEDVV